MEIWFLSASAHPESFGNLLKRLIDKNEINATSAIAAKISHLSKQGGHPSPPYAKPLKNVREDLNEICHKYNQAELLRIYYFVDHEKQRMILLNIIFKPNGRKYASKYDGNAIEKIIQKSIQEALKIKTKYITSQDDYELFNI